MAPLAAQKEVTTAKVDVDDVFNPGMCRTLAKLLKKEKTNLEERTSGRGLPSWAKEEAVQYFRDNLALDDKFQSGWSRSRMDICLMHFRKVIDGWYPGSKEFWKQIRDFCKEWSGWKSGPPVSRPLSAGRLNNYLTHLYRGSTHIAEEVIPSAEMLAAVGRFGIRVSDIRLTSDSIYQACRDFTGLDWHQGSATDPCPWPVPQAFNGLLISWKLFAQARGHNRVYLNPPWSQLDSWLHKATLEYNTGLQILIVVPRWTEESCISTLASTHYSLRFAPRLLQIKTRRLWDAEFAHPTSGKAMAPLDITLIWMV
mmetsp:Transcript_44239/g.79494  ORF Transcript_44239/g.79494 Transcript_44239/m.79494 type:complete len:312 (+) Transcript_44239:56-991(+)